MRMTRGQWLGNHPHKERKPTTREVAEFLSRHVRRQLKAKGLWEPKPRRRWAWQFGAVGGTVEAHCRSDARGLIKQALGIKQKDRLPPQTHIEEIPNGLDRDVVHSGGSVAASA